jgi:hypothetical protein
VYHVRELADVEAANERRCAGKDPQCKHYDCDRPMHETVPVCRQGACAGVLRPIGRMEGGF